MEATQNSNIASVAWSDHVIFGESDGRLDTVPALRRRMNRWKTDLGAQIIHWRCSRDRINGKFFQGKGYRHFARSQIQDIQWKNWVERGVVDQLIIDQNSSKCPSMRHDLWPMHRGYGYIQNYLNGSNMDSLEEDLTSVYQPIFYRQLTKLYIARQWRHRAPDKEQVLLEHPCVDGLVFSTFRHDNPGPIRRNDWTA